MQRNATVPRASGRPRFLTVLMVAVVLMSGLAASAWAVVSEGGLESTIVHRLTGQADTRLVAEPVLTAHPVEQLSIIYASSADGSGMVANWRVRTVDIESDAAQDEFIGTFFWGSITPLGTAQYPSDYGFYQGGENRLLQISGAGVVQTDALPQNADAAAIDPASGSLFAAYGLSVREIDSEGVEVQVHELEPPVAGERTLDGNPTKGLQGLGSVSAVAVGPGGVGYAFVSNGVNSALEDLSDGRRVDLQGYGLVNDVTVAADGMAYVILLDGSRSVNHYTLAVVDLNSMSLVGTVDTGILRGTGSIEGSINGLRVLTTQSGEVLVFANRSIDESRQEIFLMRLNSDFTLTDIPVPDNSGLNATIGVDGKVYMYGGLAAENVSILNLETGTVDKVDDAAPQGTYVMAVFTY